MTQWVRVTTLVVPLHAVVCGQEGDNTLYAGRTDEAHAHVPGKFGLHLRGANIQSADGTLEIPAPAGVAIEVLVSDEPLVWVHWAELLALGEEEICRAALSWKGAAANAATTHSGGGVDVAVLMYSSALVSSVTFKGSTHPAVGCVSSGIARLLHGGNVVTVDNFKVLCRRHELPTKIVHVEAALTPVPDGYFHGDPLLCAPLRSVSELLQWAPPLPPSIAGCGEQQQQNGQMKNATLISSASRQLQPLLPFHTVRCDRGGHHSQSADSASRVVVCHDMKGGYLRGDRAAKLPLVFATGGEKQNNSEEAAAESTTAAEPTAAYTIQHWHAVDTFIYFSHSRVTVPPDEWIRQAHTNGVTVLGTFITEHSEGAKDCMLMLSTEETMEAVANQLVQLALYYGFDGWLVNIESPLPTHLVENLLSFMELLHVLSDSAGLETMWYDAITTTGQVRWQNALSPLNAPFFHRASSLFVNYFWTPARVAASAKAAASAVGGSRERDVLFGVDCFGRGSYLGGGNSTGAALAVPLHSYGLSAAIFAPGWTLERLEGASGVVSRSEFLRSDAAMWKGIVEVAPRSRNSGHALLKVGWLPYHTSFVEPTGNSFWAFGRRCAERGWVQLSAADPECNERALTGAAASWSRRKVFWGTRCLLLKPATTLPLVELSPEMRNASTDTITICLTVQGAAADMFLVRGDLVDGDSIPFRHHRPDDVGNLSNDPLSPNVDDFWRQLQCEVHLTNGREEWKRNDSNCSAIGGTVDMSAFLLYLRTTAAVCIGRVQIYRGSSGGKAFGARDDCRESVEESTPAVVAGRETLTAVAVNTKTTTVDENFVACRLDIGNGGRDIMLHHPSSLRQLGAKQLPESDEFSHAAIFCRQTDDCDHKPTFAGVVHQLYPYHSDLPIPSGTSSMQAVVVSTRGDLTSTGWKVI